MLRVIGISKSDTTALVACSFLIQGTRIAVRCGVCCSWAVCKNCHIADGGSAVVTSDPAIVVVVAVVEVVAAAEAAH